MASPASVGTTLLGRGRTDPYFGERDGRQLAFNDTGITLQPRISRPAPPRCPVCCRRKSSPHRRQSQFHDQRRVSTRRTADLAVPNTSLPGAARLRGAIDFDVTCFARTSKRHRSDYGREPETFLRSFDRP